MSKPIFHQLYEQLRNEIIDGNISVGDKLPSIRKLSQYLNVSKNTIDSAYQQLLVEGYIKNIPRVGFIVEELRMELAKESEVHIIPYNTYEAEADKDFIYDFAPRDIDYTLFNKEAWRKVNSAVIKEDFEKILGYGDPQGEYKLRKEIVKYIYENRGIKCAPENLIIGAGTQFFLSIVCQILNDNSKTIAFEEPGSNYAKAIFKNHQFSVDPIPVTDDGIDVSKLQESKCKLVFVTPSHQFPKGVVMSIKNRIELLNWSVDKNSLIIEDDYDNGLRYFGKSIPALKSLDKNDNVIYISSLSKVFSPGLRVSYMILPEKMMKIYLSKYKMYEQTVPTQIQLALARFIDEGYFYSHLRKLRKVCLSKHKTITNSIKKHMKENVNIVLNDAGMRVILELKTNMSETEVIESARLAGVRITSISKYHINKKHGISDSKVSILLSYKSIQLDDIENAIKALNTAWFK